MLGVSDHGKRHRRQSTHSSASGSSSLMRPPAKRGRNDPQIVLAIDTSSSGAIRLSQDMGPDNLYDGSGSSLRNTAAVVDAMDTFFPKPPLRPDRGNLDGRPNPFCELELGIPSNVDGPGKESDQTPEFPSRWDSVDEISKKCRAITHQRPVSTYTSREMENMQLTAEYFEAMGHEEDAFALYAFLLKRLHEERPQDKATFLHAVINYSRCASTPEHCDIIQHHLRDQAWQLSAEVDSCLLYHFLIEMALAETYSRKYDTASVKTHLRQARLLVRAPDDLYQVIGLLPLRDRSLDLMLWHSIRRVCDPRSERLLLAEDSEEFCSWWSKLCDLERVLLQRVPGPFELNGPVMGNPCIRLCLKWCHQNLRLLGYIPTMGLVSPGKTEREEEVETVAMMSLFTCLWNVRVNARGLSEADSWTFQTQFRIGVDATELLMIICAQIVHRSSISEGSGGLFTKDKLIHSFQQGAERLLGQSDDVLARGFLEAFVQYRKLEEEPSKWLENLRQRSRAGNLGQLQRAFDTTFEESRDIPTQADEIAKSMTMTSSIRSSNPSLLNFRKAKEAIEVGVKKLKEQPSMSTISFGYSSRRSRWSLFTMGSRSSQFMERTSLSLQSTGSAA